MLVDLAALHVDVVVLSNLTEHYESLLAIRPLRWVDHRQHVEELLEAVRQSRCIFIASWLKFRQRELDLPQDGAVAEVDVRLLVSRRALLPEDAHEVVKLAVAFEW